MLTGKFGSFTFIVIAGITAFITLFGAFYFPESFSYPFSSLSSCFESYTPALFDSTDGKEGSLYPFQVLSQSRAKSQKARPCRRPHSHISKPACHSLCGSSVPVEEHS